MMYFRFFLGVRLCLIFSLVKCTHQKQSMTTDTMLTLLKNLVIDNSQTTVLLNSTALRTLIALSDAAKMNSPLQEHAKGVSFSVRVKAKELKRLANGDAIKYDDVFTNDGNGYDKKTGVFTCPVAGSYMFVVDSRTTSPVTLIINVNNKRVAFLDSNAIFHGRHGKTQISRTVIFKLNKGDRVKVEVCNYWTNVSPLGSGFSGFKLY